MGSGPAPCFEAEPAEAPGRGCVDGDQRDGGSMAIEIVPFKRGIDRDKFGCGKPDLDEWIRRYAGQSERNDTTRTFLALEDDDELVGYYATKACELDLDEASSVYGVGRRRYPVPAMLIARLAVSEQFQGRGVGSVLLFDALHRLVEVSRSIGFEVVVVDAIDHDASAFYRRFGFTAFEDDDLHLFLTTKNLKLTFDSI
ncbi:GNAT family N-acetyltransferase [Microbacterium sp. SLBN-111]|uniref:GNAT family N-acetyltransferase n=1 Tax=Microbacterium sp. SLBN-111 TaxID=3377733 RepID=UPI003C77578F